MPFVGCRRFSIKCSISQFRPADNLCGFGTADLIREAVAKLEGRAATVFALRYFEGYDNGRIAEVLGTSQMVVAVTLHRARTRLRKRSAIIWRNIMKHSKQELDAIIDNATRDIRDEQIDAVDHRQMQHAGWADVSQADGGRTFVGSAANWRE